MKNLSYLSTILLAICLCVQGLHGAGSSSSSSSSSSKPNPALQQMWNAVLYLPNIQSGTSLKLLQDAIAKGADVNDLTLYKMAPLNALINYVIFDNTITFDQARPLVEALVKAGAGVNKALDHVNLLIKAKGYDTSMLSGSENAIESKKLQKYLSDLSDVAGKTALDASSK